MAAMYLDVVPPGTPNPDFWIVYSISQGYEEKWSFRVEAMHESGYRDSWRKIVVVNRPITEDDHHNNFLLDNDSARFLKTRSAGDFRIRRIG